VRVHGLHARPLTRAPLQVLVCTDTWAQGAAIVVLLDNAQVCAMGYALPFCGLFNCNGLDFHVVGTVGMHIVDAWKVRPV